MKTYRIALTLLVLISFFSCQKNEEVDRDKPVIDLSIQDAFPVNCDTIYFGESFDLRLLFTDNSELGSYSIDIHHNFDHHSHSTELTECTPDSIKDPVNPFLFIQDFTIPEGQSVFITDLAISIPSGNGTELYDEGDYHFFISLTDKEGWSAQKGLGIKMLHQ